MLDGLDVGSRSERRCNWCGSYDVIRRPPHYGQCCTARRCRHVAAYFDDRQAMRSRWFGPLVYLYHLAHFVHVMAQPKTARQRQFAKRFAHRRAA